MTEAEWLACADPTRLIYWVTGDKKSRRKLRLLAVEFARRFSASVTLVYPSVDFNRLIDIAEQFADGATSRSEFLAAVTPVRRILPALRIRLRGFVEREFIEQVQCTLSDVFLMLTYEAIDTRWFAIICTMETAIRESERPEELRVQMPESLCRLVRDIFGNPFRPVTFVHAWLTSDAVSLARQMYDTREFSAMPILADALQDAGCDNPDVLNHCRGDGLHVRGCWVVDLVLGKE